MSSQSESATLPNVPKEWPGAFGLYNYSKEAVKFNFMTLFWIWLATALVGGLARQMFDVTGELISSIIGVLSSTVYVFVYLASIRRKKIEVDEAVRKALPLWLRMIGLSILTVLIIGVSFLLLIIPGLFVLPRVMLASYFLVDKDMGIVEALKASWAATEGHALQIWTVIGTSLLMALLCITIIGIPVAIYLLIMYSAAVPLIYEFLTKNNKSASKA